MNIRSELLRSHHQGARQSESSSGLVQNLALIPIGRIHGANAPPVIILSAHHQRYRFLRSLPKGHIQTRGLANLP